MRSKSRSKSKSFNDADAAKTLAFLSELGFITLDNKKKCD